MNLTERKEETDIVASLHKSYVEWVILSLAASMGCLEGVPYRPRACRTVSRPLRWVIAVRV